MAEAAVKHTVLKPMAVLRPFIKKELRGHAISDQEISAVLRADIEEGTDIGMIQRGDGFGFPFEAELAREIGGKMWGENFNGNGAVETRVASAVDFAQYHPRLRQRVFHRDRALVPGASGMVAGDYRTEYEAREKPHAQKASVRLVSLASSEV